MSRYAGYPSVMFNINAIVTKILLIDVILVRFCTGQSTDITLFDTYYNVYCSAANTLNESAITWLYSNYANKPPSSSPNVEYIYEAKENTANYFNPKGLFRNSLQEFADIILDRRWEDFEEIETSGTRITDFVTFSNDNFQFAFSIRIKENGYLYICDAEGNPWEANNCYFFVLGGWKYNIVALRRCKLGEHYKSYDDFPDKPCSNLRAKYNATQVISQKVWNHFEMRYIYNTISLYHYGREDPILTFHDDDPFKPRSAVIRSKDKGYWKLHNYNFRSFNGKYVTYGDFTISTYRVCIKVYIKPCSECDITLTLQYTWKGGQIVSATAPMRGEWQSVTLQSKENIKGAQLKLIVVSEGKVSGPYFVGDIVNCASEEVHTITTKHRNNPCCHSVKHSLKICKDSNAKPIYKTDEDYSCPTNTFGKNCIPCNILQNCNKYYKYCEISISGDEGCYCYNGYIGANCDNSCRKGFYGRECKMQCSKGCNDCDAFVGCTKCKNNIYDLENNCTTFRYPVLTNKPKVLSISHDSVNIQIDFSYSGQEQPVSYEIQTDNGGGWKSSGLGKFQDSTTITVDNLSPGTTYQLRIILVTQYGKKEDRDEFIQFQEFTTTCKDITKDDISLIIEGTSVTIFTNNNVPSCALQNLNVFDGFYNQTLNNRINTMLPKCSNHTITISYKNGTKLFDYNIRTGEDNEQIECLSSNATATTSTLTWEYRKSPNVPSYIISYEYAGSLYEDCPLPTVPTQTFQVYETKAEVNNLVPYSKYNVRIINHEYGVFRHILITTEPEENMNFDELDDPIFSQPVGDSTLRVSLSINCDKVKGPMQIPIQAQCISDWCTDKIQTTRFVFDNRASLQEHFFLVTGLTEYNIEMNALRSKRTAGSKRYRIITNATASGPVTDLVVYSRTDQGLNIRWKPPYPPMGRLIKYQLIYFYDGRWSPTYEATKPVVTCDFWMDHHCTELTNLYTQTAYTIMVIPVNYPDLSGTSKTVTGFTKQEAPNPPSFLNLIWTEPYKSVLVEFPHPDITNGPLTLFEVYFGKDKHKTVKIDKENLTYSYMISKFPPASSLNIQVRVINNGGQSEFVSNTTFTPPPIPDLDSKRIEITANLTNIDLAVPKIMLIENVKCSMAILVTNVLTTSNTAWNGFSDEDRTIVKESKAHETSWVAWKKNISKSENLLLRIGDDSTPSNQALYPNTEYIITLFVKNTYHDKTNVFIWKSTIKTLTGDESNLNLLLLLLLIIPVLCIGIFILRSRGVRINVPTIDYGRTTGNTNPRSDLLLQPVQPVRLRAKPAIYQNAEEAMEDNEFSRTVRLCELENYIKECLASGEFERQHELFPRGQTKPWTFGTKPENKSKNRYANLAAYDHTRVRLDIINNDPNSEYINANYIDGYNCPRAFIATQGPKVNTLNDFWRMIWQEQVEYIVMIANLVEGGKKKVAKYWPEINETLSFGDISVKYMSVTVFANYEERIFTACFREERRQIKQYHFTAWPDHGVPLYAQSLGPFIKKILALPQEQAPIVVHCSAGVGRTGTLILTDICLRMAAKEGYIDVLYYQHKIREERPNMVDNVEQYKLVHLLLLHCLVAPETSIICTENMNIIVEEILASKEVMNQMKHLDENVWQDEAMRTSATKVSLPVVNEKNRFRNIIPDEYSRIILTAYPPTDENSMYINAINVDGFQVTGKFIATQYPLKNTVGDFWRLTIEQEITVAVCLNELCLDDGISATFFPSNSSTTLTPVPYLKITLNSIEEGNDFNIYTLNVVNSKKKGDIINFTLIHLKNWKHDQICPENPVNLLALFEKMNRIGKYTERILISCYDGVRACGLYSALCFLIEQIKLEQTCDVCLAVRTVRRSRKEFVREIEQFRFLYLCGLEYVKMFEMYSNFRL